MTREMSGFRYQVMSFVLANGKCTISQVVAGVGPSISSALAARSARKDLLARELNHIVESGKRNLINNELGRLARMGRLCRIGPGLYGPPDYG